MNAPENLSITEVVKHYTNSIGEPASYTVQQATVPVTVGGETREVLVERFSPSHSWLAVDELVIVRFPTGTKEHLQRPGVHWHKQLKEYFCEVHGFRNANRCRVVRWANEDDKGSGWN